MLEEKGIFFLIINSNVPQILKTNNLNNLLRSKLTGDVASWQNLMDRGFLVGRKRDRLRGENLLTISLTTTLKL